VGAKKKKMRRRSKSQPVLSKIQLRRHVRSHVRSHMRSHMSSHMSSHMRRRSDLRSLRSLRLRPRARLRTWSRRIG